MPNARSAARINIRPLDDLFEPTIAHQAEGPGESLPSTLPLDRLHPFPNHPFRVVEDQALLDLADSIRENGLLQAIKCRPDGNGDYQIVSGHRRAAAAKLAGLATVSVEIEGMSDERAIVAMVDSNMHRDHILPSEKAFALKMKVEALERERQMGLVVSAGRRSTEMVGEESGVNYRDVMRYIRLTELSPELLGLVDAGKLKFHPAVELSHLKPGEQEIVYAAIADTSKTPSLTQAKNLKQLSKNGQQIARNNVVQMLRGNKTEPRTITFKADELRGFFPQGYSAEQVKEAILDILEARQRARAGRER